MIEVAGRKQVRVVSVQYAHAAIPSFEAFMARVEEFVRVAAGWKADFVVFPEMFTLQLLCFAPHRLSPEASVDVLSDFTAPFVHKTSELAKRYGVNVVAGSHIARNAEGAVRNTAYLCRRDGSVATQDKIQPTPSERDVWGVTGGTKLEAIDTDCGKVGVLICYDSEFPELARVLTDQGADILFVPFCTEDRHGYLRVRYCSQARAVENQSYVVLSGNVGHLPNVENFDLNYGQSCILTPCDMPFARDGVLVETAVNVEGVAAGDLDLDLLRWARKEGTVRNLGDRRLDLYGVDWKGG